MIRIGIVDHQPVVLWGLRAMLTATPDFAVLAAHDDIEDLNPGGLDVVIMNLHQGGNSPCYSAVARLAEHTNILLISSERNSAAIEQCVRVGAKGHLPNSASPEAFTAAVRTLAAGGSWTSEAEVDPGEPLSPRERQVLAYIAHGMTHQQTASRLGISKHTVDTYVKRVRSKLQVGNKAELTRAAMSHA